MATCCLASAENLNKRTAQAVGCSQQKNNPIHINYLPTTHLWDNWWAYQLLSWQHVYCHFSPPTSLSDPTILNTLLLPSNLRFWFSVGFFVVVVYFTYKDTINYMSQNASWTEGRLAARCQYRVDSISLSYSRFVYYIYIYPVSEREQQRKTACEPAYFHFLNEEGIRYCNQLLLPVGNCMLLFNGCNTFKGNATQRYQTCQRDFSTHLSLIEVVQSINLPLFQTYSSISV